MHSSIFFHDKAGREFEVNPGSDIHLAGMRIESYNKKSEIDLTVKFLVILLSIKTLLLELGAVNTYSVTLIGGSPS